MTLPKTPSLRLDGRNALVTGASKGIGLAAAVALAEAGARVTLMARQSDELDRAIEQLRDAGHAARALALDVTDLGAVARAVADGPCHSILVNNAGTNRPKPFVDVSIEDFDAVMGLNLRAAFFVAQAVAARLLREGKPGSIINMSSQMGHVGAADRTVYCASKAAIEGLTRAMAVELGKAGIRVNALAPTFIETPMTAPFMTDAFRGDVLRKIKLGRLGRPEDLMGAIVYMAGDASSLMTGSSLVVDGGWTAE